MEGEERGEKGIEGLFLLWILDTPLLARPQNVMMLILI